MNYKIIKYEKFNKTGGSFLPKYKIEKDFGFLNLFFNFELKNNDPKDDILEFDSIESAEKYIHCLKNNKPVNCIVKTVVKTI